MQSIQCSATLSSSTQHHSTAASKDTPHQYVLQQILPQTAAGMQHTADLDEPSLLLQASQSAAAHAQPQNPPHSPMLPPCSAVGQHTVCCKHTCNTVVLQQPTAINRDIHIQVCQLEQAQSVQPLHYNWIFPPLVTCRACSSDVQHGQPHQGLPTASIHSEKLEPHTPSDKTHSHITTHHTVSHSQITATE